MTGVLRPVSAFVALCVALLALAPALAQPAVAPGYSRAGGLHPGPNAAVVIPGARVVPRDAVVGMVSGGLAGTYIRIANDLTNVFDISAFAIRILPIVSKGSLQNISDLINVPDVDVAITQSDVLAFLRQNSVLTANNLSIAYIAKLYEEEVHVLAGPDVASLADLAGRKVNYDTRGSGGSVTSAVVFGALDIKPDPTYDDQETALAKLKNGEIAALVYVAGKPARLFTDLPPSGLHFVPIPLNAALLDGYTPSQFGPADYPGLVPENTAVDTVAVGAVMAVYNWPPGTQRYVRLARFTDLLFDSLPTLQSPGHHPKWRDVSLSAQVPGWTRFPAATQWLQRHAATSQPAAR